MLKQRIITAIVLAGVVLWALFGWSDFFYALLLLVAAFACAWEWSALGNLKLVSARVGFSAVVTLVTFLFIFFSSVSVLKPLALIGALSWIAITLDLYVRPTVPAEDTKVRWPLLILAAAILVISVAGLFWLRGAYSPFLIVYIVALVAAADIGAYFTGRKFGRRKLAVEISQGKTVEGALGGLGAAFCLALFAAQYFSSAHLSVISLFVFSMIAALFSIAGDLFISRAKRTKGVKDSGNLLPGHGGVLDRFDGLLAAIPWMLFAILWG